MSFSNFHPELWNPAWGVSTIIIGLISFMNTEDMTTGGMRASNTERRAHAARSLAFNMSPQKNPKFQSVFSKDQLEAIGAT